MQSCNKHSHKVVWIRYEAQAAHAAKVNAQQRLPWSPCLQTALGKNSFQQCIQLLLPQTLLQCNMRLLLQNRSSVSKLVHITACNKDGLHAEGDKFIVSAAAGFHRSYDT